jgi:hypothetical protein
MVTISSPTSLAARDPKTWGTRGRVMNVRMVRVSAQHSQIRPETKRPETRFATTSEPSAKEPPQDQSQGGSQYCLDSLRGRSGLGLRLRHRRGLGNLTSGNTPSAHPHPPTFTLAVDDLDRLEVRQPAPPRPVVSVADVVPRGGALAARVAHSRHLSLPT